MVQRRSTKRLETRDRLLKSAALCFARDGFDRATVKEIASAAGVTVPTLYSHFEGKQTLADSLLADVLSDAETLFDVLLPRGLTFAQKLELLLAHQFRWVEERRHAFQFLQNYHPQDEAEIQQSVRSKHLDRLSEWLTAQGCEAETRTDAGLTARVIDSLTNMFFVRWMERGDEAGSLTRCAATAAEIVLHGIAAADGREALEGPE